MGFLPKSGKLAFGLNPTATLRVGEPGSTGRNVPRLLGARREIFGSLLQRKDEVYTFEVRKTLEKPGVLAKSLVESYVVEAEMLAAREASVRQVIQDLEGLNGSESIGERGEFAFSQATIGGFSESTSESASLGRIRSALSVVVVLALSFDPNLGRLAVEPFSISLEDEETIGQ